MNSPVFTALARTPLLAGLDGTALELIEREGVTHSFAEGEWIVREGQEGHSFFILTEGDVEIVKGDCSVVLATLRCGDFFGEMCVVDPVRRGASVRALGKVAVLEIQAATLHHLYQKMPAQYAIVILNLARDVARRLRSLDEAFAARAC